MFDILGEASWVYSVKRLENFFSKVFKKVNRGESSVESIYSGLKKGIKRSPISIVFFPRNQGENSRDKKIRSPWADPNVEMQFSLRRKENWGLRTTETIFFAVARKLQGYVCGKIRKTVLPDCVALSVEWYNIMEITWSNLLPCMLNKCEHRVSCRLVHENHDFPDF